MSSSAATERSWSLNRRMAVTFALTTCVIVLLYGAGSLYLAFDMVRDNAKDFMEHELDELALGIEGCGATPECIAAEMDKILLVSKDAPCAFRLRDAVGEVLIERGPRPLLLRVTEPVAPHESWRRYLFSERVAVQSRPMDVPKGASLEIFVNSRAAINELWRYTQASALTFLLSVVLAGFAGWYTARRGLSGLREMIAQAKGISLPGAEASIRLEGAPDEVREVGAALNGMLARIRDGLKDMQTFTAGLAHELRSPLQNLIGETEVMLLSDRDAADYRRLLRSNLEDLHDLSDAVDNLVAYCRKSEPRGHEGSPERFDLAREAEIRIERLRRSAELQGVAISLQAEGDTELRADREGCLRVLRNLVGNAIEWSPDGGRVDVRIVGGVDGVRIEVADEGPGMPAELGDRVFDPFVSGRKAVGRRAGYGLGLTICRSVMEDHDGALSHAPRDGGGTVFVAEFPRRHDLGGEALDPDGRGRAPAVSVA